jgi:hypothetical protein
MTVDVKQQGAVTQWRMRKVSDTKGHKVSTCIPLLHSVCSFTPTPTSPRVCHHTPTDQAGHIEQVVS